MCKHVGLESNLEPCCWSGHYKQLEMCPSLLMTSTCQQQVMSLTCGGIAH